MSISTHTPFITNILWDSTTEKERIEGRQRESFCLPSWKVQHNFSGDVYSEYATVAVSKQEFSSGKQKISFNVMVYSEFSTEFWRGLPLEISITLYNLQNDVAVDSSTQPSIFAQTVGMASLFKLPLQCKSCSLVPFHKLFWARWQSGLCSSL